MMCSSHIFIKPTFLHCCSIFPMFAAKWHHFESNVWKNKWMAFCRVWVGLPIISPLQWLGGTFAFFQISILGWSKTNILSYAKTLKKARNAAWKVWHAQSFNKMLFESQGHNYKLLYEKSHSVFLLSFCGYKQIDRQVHEGYNSKLNPWQGKTIHKLFLEQNQLYHE